MKIVATHRCEHGKARGFSVEPEPDETVADVPQPEFCAKCGDQRRPRMDTAPKKG